MGYLGVRLFFVLSGFLITGILLDGIGFRKFYWRRSLRIFPAYYAALGVYALLDIESIREGWPYLLTYSQNVYFAMGGNTELVGHFWSLAVEEQFYLLWPLAILAMPRRSAPLVLALSALGALYYREFVAAGMNKFWVHWQVFGCMDLFGAGGMVACATRSGMSPVWGWLLSLGLVPAWTMSHTPFAVLFLALGFAGVVWIGARGYSWLDPLLSNQPAVLTGRVSYGLYLFHFLFVYLPAPLAFACSFGAAFVLRVLVERPFNLLKNRQTMDLGPTPASGLRSP